MNPVLQQEYRSRDGAHKTVNRLMKKKVTRPCLGDALLVVDVQNDFLSGGNLAVPDGDLVIPVLNQYIAIFSSAGLPTVASRDWHPVNHCSFTEQGGPWPPHCVADTAGADFAAGLSLPETTLVISKAIQPDKDAYSAFDGTNLEQQLRKRKITRIFVGGLATDYCVVSTVRDALALSFRVGLLADAVRGVNIRAGDDHRALAEMQTLGAEMFTLEELI